MVTTRPLVGIDHKIRWDDLEWLYHWWIEGQEILPATIIPSWHHIQGVAARKKAATIMTRIWNQPYWQDESHHETLKKTLKNQRLVGYWGLFVTAYPFFRDTAATIGRFLTLSDHFTTRQVYDRLAAQYGDTERIKVAVRMILGSLTEWQVLTRVKRGEYRLGITPVVVKERTSLAFVMHASLYALAQEWMAMDGLIYLPWWFPFRIQPYRAAFQESGFLVELSGDDHFMVGEMG